MSQVAVRNSFTKGLFFRLNSIIMTILILIFTALIFISSYSIKKRVYKTEFLNLNRRVVELADIVDSKIVALGIEVDLMSMNVNLLQAYGNDDRKSVKDILNKQKELGSFLESIFVIDRDGFIFTDDSGEGTGTDLRESTYYMNLQQKPEEIYIGNIPVQSPVTGQYVIIVAKSIIIDGQFAGIFASAMDFTQYSDNMITNKKYNEAGYPFIFTTKGIIVAHPVKDVRMTDANTDGGVIQNIIESGDNNGFLPYEYNGRKKYMAYIRMKNMPWNVAVTIYEDDLLNIPIFLRELIIIISIFAFISASFFINIFLSRVIISRVKLMEKKFMTSSEGNLGIRLLPTNNDEITSVFNSFNIMMDNFSEFLKNVKEKLRNVNDSSNEMSINMTETAAAVNQINSNIENVKMQMVNQAANTSQTATAVEELTRNIDRLNNSIGEQSDSISQSSAAIEEMASSIQSINKTVNNAEKEIEEMNNSANKGRKTLEEVLRIIREIVVESEQLTEANTLISNLSSQTNLLSMNAAIEAAHAGDAGKGFSVVADEIRKLAELSSEQSKAVKNNVTKIKGSIDSVMNAATETTREFNGINNAITNVNSVFQVIDESLSELNLGNTQILEDLERMKEISAEVNNGSEEMQRGNWQIIDAVSQLKDISHHTMNAIEEISLGINEINKAVSEEESFSKSNAEKLAEISSEADKFVTSQT